MHSGVVVLCGLLLGQAAASTQATGRIAGRIVADGTNAPIAGAQIMLLPAPPPPTSRGGQPSMMTWRPIQAQTDGDGRFAIDKVQPGSYRLEVHKTGFAPPADNGRASLTDVVAGKTTDVTLALQRGAVIAGKVLDAQGEPLTDVRMMAMRRMERPAGMPAPPGSAFFLAPAPGGGQMQTNDLGEYRLAGLAAGEYYVAAMPNGGMPFGGPGTPAASTGKANTTTYYPGTIDQASATPIKVAAGETVYNIVFAMQSAPGFRVSGRVVDENGAAVAGAMVMLMPSRPGSFMGPPSHATSGDDGGFTFADVPSATYRVHAMIPIQMNAGHTAVATQAPVAVGGVVSSGSIVSWTSGSGGGRAAAINTDQSQEVTVNGADLTGVRVVVQR